MPTSAWLNGDFSTLKNAAGQDITIFDPLTAANDGTGNFIRQAFPGNVIPNNRIDGAAKVMTNLWGRANSPGLPFTAVNNFTANASVGGDNDQFLDEYMRKMKAAERAAAEDKAKPWIARMKPAGPTPFPNAATSLKP